MFSVIIPTYNRVQCLRETLLSIKPSFGNVKELIIVDQSRDEIFFEIEKFVKSLQGVSEGTSIKLIRSNVPSLTRARNVGAGVASGDWIVFCDDDVIWPQDLGIKISAFLEKYDDLALVGGYDYEHVFSCSLGNADATKAIKLLTEKKGYPFWARWLRAWIGLCSYSANRAVVTSAVCGAFPEHVAPICPTEWAMGFFFMVPHKIFAEWGIRFDENLKRYAYAEDLDFTHRVYLRAKQENLRCVYVPEIGVWHKCSQEWRIDSKWGQYAGFLNRVYIAEKLSNNSVWRKLYYAWGIFRGDVWNFLRAVKSGNAGIFLKVRFDYFKNRSRIRREGWYFLLECNKK